MLDLLKLIVLGTLILRVQNSMIEINGFNLPNIDDWWGAEESKCDNDTSIRHFKIKFEEQMISDLKQRLKNHRPFTPPLEGAAFHYGFNTDNMQNWIDYWANGYNFTEREAYLNKFPHFKTNIQGLDMHFIRVKSDVIPENTDPITHLQFISLIRKKGKRLPRWWKAIDEVYDGISLPRRCLFTLAYKADGLYYVEGNTDAGREFHTVAVRIINVEEKRRVRLVPDSVEVVPLLLLHGWPGSIREFYGAIPLLTAYCAQRGFAVEVIVPSLPGFGFSGAAVRKGLGATEMAVVFRNLMHRLGFKKFYIQGGDWGTHICNSIAILFPGEVLGYHTNYAVSFAPGTFATWFFGSLNKQLQSLVVEASLAERLYPIITILKGLVTETGYLHLHATKPDTIGVAMSDTPSGLLAYILQIVSWASRSDYIDREDGGLYELYPCEELIDNLMIYWMNNAFTTAIRIYAETFNMRNIEMKLFALSTPVPVCTVHAKSELLYQPPNMLQYKFPNLLNSTVLEDYGHFLAMEKPDLFSENVLHAIETFRKWHAKGACKDEL